MPGIPVSVLGYAMSPDSFLSPPPPFLHVTIRKGLGPRPSIVMVTFSRIRSKVSCMDERMQQSPLVYREDFHEVKDHA